MLESVRYSRYSCEKTFRVRSLLPRMKLPSSYNFVTRAYFQNLKTLVNRSTLCDQIDIGYIFQLCFAVEFYVVEIFKISPKMRLCSFRLCAIFLLFYAKVLRVLGIGNFLHTIPQPFFYRHPIAFEA